MPDYKRLVSYMYTYEEGKKRNNVGYVKVESRNGQCKFTIHATALSYGDKTVTVYGFRRLHGSVEGIKLGTGTFRNGILDTRIVSDPENLAGSEIAINDIGGIVLYLNDMKYLATSWEEEAITYSQVISIVSKRNTYNKSVTSAKSTIQEKVEPILPKVETVAAASVIVDTNIASVNEVMKEVYPENIVETIENETTEEGKEEAYPEKTVENEAIEEAIEEVHQESTIEIETTEEVMEESHTLNNVVSFDGFVQSTDDVVSSSDSLVEDISNNVVSESYAQIDTLDTQEALEQQSAYYNPYPTNQSDSSVEAAQLFKRRNHNNNQSKTNSNNMTGTMNYSRYRNRAPQNQRQHQQNQQQNQQRQNQQNQQQNQQRQFQQNQQQNQQRQFQQNQQQNQQRQFQQYQQQYHNQNHMPQTPNNCMNPTPVKPTMPLVSPQEEPQIASRLMKEFPRMHPFEDNEVVWSVKIEPKDLGILPVDVWPLANNSFLLHGFYAHKHLLFAKMNTVKGTIYIICVPGIYDDRERFLAKMFGFENFKGTKRGEVHDGESGYWYLPIRLV